MKKYLIIGGAGFVGSHLSDALLKLGFKVVIVDDFSTGGEKNINRKVKFYNINADKSGSLDKIFKKEKPDFVYHLAGVINLRRSIKDPLFLGSLDILGRTKKILDACYGNKAKKIIFISSGGAIYQNAKEVPTKESYPAHPDSLYGLANLIIERYMEMFCNQHNMNYVILRLSNIFGPRQWESGVVPSLILNLLRKKCPVIYGDGNQTRDFIYVDDATKALIVAAGKAESGIFNVGSGREISLNDAFKTIKIALDSKIKPAYKKLENPETKRSALDIGKIKKTTGWKPETNFKEGVIKTISWFKENEN